MVETVVIASMLLTALFSAVLSFIPAVWGSVFSFTSGSVAVATGFGAIMASTTVDSVVVWTIVSFAIVAIAWANILATNIKYRRKI